VGLALMCSCEERSILEWLTRVINLIFARNLSLDCSFREQESTFIYYKRVNMKEVKNLLKMHEVRHDFVDKYFFNFSFE